MHRLLTSITILLLISVEPASAVRVMELLEGAYELRLVDATLPRSSFGSVTFKTCETCSLETVPVTSSTKYFIGDREVTLAELTEQSQLVRQRPDVAEWTQLMVFYTTDTHRATRLVLQVL